MLNLPQQTLDKVKKYLIRQQKSVDQELKTIEKDDPVLADGVAEASESGTDSWQADVHARIAAVKNDLMNLSKKITNSLLKIKVGTYGNCESCGKAIEADRLAAVPTANLCVICSKKLSKK